MRTRLASVLAVAALLVAGAARPAAADDDWLAELLARTDTIAAKVANVRGLALKRPIEKGVVTDEELRARIIARMDEDAPPAKRALEAAVAKRWGLIPWATDLDQLVIDLLTEQIAGFYDPAERKLYIASHSTFAASEADTVMAHEIDHALQDQHFDLDPWMKQVKDDADASAARSAVVEGDGVVLMTEFLLAETGQAPPWNNALQVKLMLAAMEASASSGGAGPAFDRAPLALREQMIFPYQAGFAFIVTLRQTQPWKKVDEVFTKRPPVSTEQILHPELYLANERPDAIAESKAPAGLTQLHAATWGEAGWGQFLRAHGVDKDVSVSAAAGWGGDRAVLYGPTDGAAHPERTTAVALTTWDSEADALEAFDAIGKALDAMVVGALIVADEREVRWIDATGRITAATRRGDRIAVVVGAPYSRWRAIADAVWTWKVTLAKP